MLAECSVVHSIIVLLTERNGKLCTHVIVSAKLNYTLFNVCGYYLYEIATYWLVPLDSRYDQYFCLTVSSVSKNSVWPDCGCT